MTTAREQLDKWEETLQQAVAGGDVLLGELGYNDGDREAIGRLLADTGFFYLRHQLFTIDEVLRRVHHQWPLTFALYLVLEGIHNYSRQGHEYWAAPKERLGLESNHTSPCGELFLSTLSRFGLPTFTATGGRRFVTPILLHGGVPNAALDEFFDFLLRQEIRPHRLTVDTHTLLAHWRATPDEHLRHLSRPVKRFLRDGGLVAEDFVDRCLDLLRLFDPAAADTLDLPERVLTAWWRWRADHEAELHERVAGRRIRLQRPFLTVAPYAGGVTIYLPPQQLPTAQAVERLTWWLHIAGEPPREIATDRQRIENGYHYVAAASLAPPPALVYTLELLADGEPWQRWELAGPADDRPLVFDPYDSYQADALDDEESRRPGRRWLLLRRDTHLSGPDGSERHGLMARLFDRWAAYQLEEWTLSPGEYTLWAVNEADRHGLGDFTIVPEPTHLRPYLDGGTRPLPDLADTDAPLFSGRPPALVIHTSQPTRWRITVRAAGNAQPTGIRSFCVADLPHSRVGDATRIELADERLLGSQPIGKFELVVRGPLGRSRTLGLRVVPSLQVERPTLRHLARPDEPATLTLRCRLGDQLTQSPPQADVYLTEAASAGDRQAYQIVAAPSVIQLTLLLSLKEGGHIPLTIPIHRLRWRLAGDDAPWQTQATSLFPALLPPTTPFEVALPLLSDAPRLGLGWQLLDTAEQCLGQVRADLDSAASIIAIPLAEWMDSWRERREWLCVRLVLVEEGQADPIHLDALYLLPHLDLGPMDYEWRTGQQNSLTLCWSTPCPGRLQLRLWPLDRPWLQEPLLFNLPPQADGYAEWSAAPSVMPVEAYLAHVVAYNPWAAPPPCPIAGQPNTLLIEPPELAQQMADLARGRDEQLPQPSSLLALLLYQHRHNQTEAFYDTNRAIGRQADTLPLEWLVRWAEQVRERDTVAYRTAQLHLTKPSALARLESNAVPDDLLARYLAHRPQQLPPAIRLRLLRDGPLSTRLDTLETLLAAPDNGLPPALLDELLAGILAHVADGSLLLRRAVTWLAPRAAVVAAYLARQHTQDAAELLRVLAESTDLAPACLWPRPDPRYQPRGVRCPAPARPRR